MKECLIFIPLILMSVVSIWILTAQDSMIMLRVKSGDHVLTCDFNDGSRVVSPDKIEGYSDGRWYFTNGSATRCKLTGVN